MTFLHVLAWTGVFMVAAFVVLLVALVPLGLRERRKANAEARRDAAQWTPVLPRRLTADAEHSGPKHRRDRDTDADPAS